MKKLKIIFAFLALLLTIQPGFHFVNAAPLIPESDTLVLKTEKHIGFGLFDRLPVKLNIEEISDDKLRAVIPPQISSPKLAWGLIDMKIWAYYNVKNNMPEKFDIHLQRNYSEKIDTSLFPSELENTFQIVFGMQGIDSIYIVDENNNNDFRDDSIRVLQEMNLENPITKPVKCQYWIHDGELKHRDSSWVMIERGSRNKIWLTVAHHLKVSLTLDKQKFEIQCMNGLPSLRFGFASPKISLTSHNGVEKDSLLLSEILEFGDYLKFGESYYRFEDVTNDGSEITLIKEEDVSDKIASQVGFLAPGIDCVTTEGDSLSLDDFSKGYLLLVNITSCFSKPTSYECYKALSTKYGGKVELLAIDESPGILQNNIDHLGLKGTFVIGKNNSVIKQNYREDFCSYTCFLIGPSGHIVDKFDILNWEKSLAKYF